MALQQIPEVHNTKYILYTSKGECYSAKSNVDSKGNFIGWQFDLFTGSPKDTETIVSWEKDEC